MSTKIRSDNYLGTYDNLPVGVPATMRFQSLPVPLGGVISDKYVSSTSSTSVTGGQLISFEVPALDCLMPGTVYMRGTISGKAATAANSAVTVSSVSDVIRRVETRIGGSTIDSISDYNKIYSVLKLCNCPEGYATNDGSILELMAQEILVSADNNVYGTAVEFCIPLITGVLTTGRALPLFLFQSPMVINIELESATNVNSTAGFDFKIDNPRLYFQTCNMGELYTSTLKKELLAYSVLRLPFTTFSSSTYGLGTGATLSVQIGENCSSLLGVLIARQLTGEKGDQYKLNGFEYLDVSIDGQAFPLYRQDSKTICFAEVQKVFSMLFDTDHTGLVDRSIHDNHFICGSSTTRFHEGNMSMVGSPVTNQINVVLKGNTAASTAYVFTIKEYSLLIRPTEGGGTIVSIST